MSAGSLLAWFWLVSLPWTKEPVAAGATAGPAETAASIHAAYGRHDRIIIIKIKIIRIITKIMNLEIEQLFSVPLSELGT